MASLSSLTQPTLDFLKSLRYRKDREKWGYTFSLHGKSWSNTLGTLRKKQRTRKRRKGPTFLKSTTQIRLVGQRRSPDLKLSTTELRDCFVTQVSAQLNDPNTVKNLMRHASLNSRSRYTRPVIGKGFSEEKTSELEVK